MDQPSATPEPASLPINSGGPRVRRRPVVMVRSLLLTGVADIWSAVRSGVPRDGDAVGLWWMVLSAASFALMAALVKKLLPHAPWQSVVLSRGALMTIIFVVASRAQALSIRGRRPWRLLLRGTLGFGAVSAYFYSVQHLPSMGDAVLIQYSHPVFVATLAPFLLREATGRGHWWLVLVAFLGVGVVVGRAGVISGDAMVGLLGSLMSGFAYMTVRTLSKSENPLTILVWFSATTVPLALIAAWIGGQSVLPATWGDAGRHAVVTVAALVGQYSLTQGLVRAGAARATAVSMTGPLFGIMFEWLFFGQSPSAWSLGGALVVVTALSLLAFNRPTSPTGGSTTRMTMVAGGRDP